MKREASMRKKTIISLILGICVLTVILNCNAQTFFFATQQVDISSNISTIITKAPTPTPTITLQPTPSNTPMPTEPTVTPSPTLTPINTPTSSALYRPSSDAVPSVIIRLGDQSQKKIALTFDDQGPLLADILQIIDKRDIKASFFLMSCEIKKNPQLWRDAVSNGHHILNHTVKHNVYLFSQSYEYMYNEIIGWEITAKKVLGKEYVDLMKKDFPIFRTPGGGKSNRLQKTLGDLGYPVTACWSCEDVYFQKHNSKKISMVEHYIKNAKNGAIFLMHPNISEYLDEIIDGVEKKGFEFSLLADIITFPSAE